jgi:mRNA-degrading endonuclease RelE of RelBE toxin-antitoxin system
MRERRFVVKFCRKAAEEYINLDKTVLGQVNDALESLEQRADEVGKKLGKKRSIDLTGSKEKKLRSKGIRIIYIISNETREVEVQQIVEVLLVDFKRNDIDVYNDAFERLQYFWEHGVQDKDDESLYWNMDKDEPIDLNEPSMIDLIFDENFDNLDESFKSAIIDSYNHGNVVEAYEIWRKANGLI